MNDLVAKKEFLYLTIASQACRIKELREALEQIVSVNLRANPGNAYDIITMAETALERDAR